MTYFPVLDFVAPCVRRFRVSVAERGKLNVSRNDELDTYRIAAKPFGFDELGIGVEDGRAFEDTRNTSNMLPQEELLFLKWSTETSNIESGWQISFTVLLSDIASRPRGILRVSNPTREVCGGNRSVQSEYRSVYLFYECNGIVHEHRIAHGDDCIIFDRDGAVAHPAHILEQRPAHKFFFGKPEIDVYPVVSLYWDAYVVGHFFYILVAVGAALYKDWKKLW